MKQDNVEYEVILVSDEEFNGIPNNSGSYQFDKKTLIVNEKTEAYFFFPGKTGQLKDHPRRSIHENLKSDIRKAKLEKLEKYTGFQILFC